MYARRLASVFVACAVLGGTVAPNAQARLRDDERVILSSVLALTLGGLTSVYAAAANELALGAAAGEGVSGEAVLVGTSLVAISVLPMFLSMSKYKETVPPAQDAAIEYLAGGPDAVPSALLAAAYDTVREAIRANPDTAVHADQLSERELAVLVLAVHEKVQRPE